MEKFERISVIEATQFTGGYSFDEMCVEWGSAFDAVKTIKNEFLSIKTPFGKVDVQIGDYIVHYVCDGEFYVYSEEDFKSFFKIKGIITQATRQQAVDQFVSSLTPHTSVSEIKSKVSKLVDYLLK